MDRALPKLAAVVALLAAVALVAAHVLAWAGPAEGGSHVQRDLAAADFAFTTAQRVAGGIAEGLPKLAYVLALAELARILWQAAPKDRGASLKRVAHLLLVGVVLLAVYPVAVSLAFSYLDPDGTRLFLLSFSPTVVVVILASVLGAGVAVRLKA